MKKVIRFILESYKRWMILLIAFFLLAIFLVVAISTYEQKSTVDERINNKKTEITIAEQKAEEEYRVKLTESSIAYKKCLENQENSEQRFIFGRSCNESFTYKQEPWELKSELKELTEIANKSWSRIFLEKVFIMQNSSDFLPPIYFLLIFVVAIPLCRFLIILCKTSFRALKLLINTGKVTGAEVRQLPIFQKYLLILMALITVMFLIVILLQIF